MLTLAVFQQSRVKKGLDKGRPGFLPASAVTVGGHTITLPRMIAERPVRRVLDSVYDALTEAIRDLHLLPGAPIPEPFVADWLQVRRSPSVKLSPDWSTWVLSQWESRWAATSPPLGH
jgi:hypothetical protein